MWSHPQWDNSEWSMHRPVKIVSYSFFLTDIELSWK
jgi:hypothetical protein